MPDIQPNQRLQANLIRLCDDLSACTKSFSKPTPAASNLANNLPLSHATSDKNVAAICESDSFKSMATLIAEGSRQHRPDCAEVELGTTTAVFFYVGPFAYPATIFGFLFSAGLEAENQIDGSATPFDSGGLVKHFGWPAKTTESPKTFFDRHELPLPRHRVYLQFSLDHLFADPKDYLEPTDVELLANPIGLSGGDAIRRRTHEVRIPGTVKLRSPQLLAVFAPRNRVATQPHIRELFSWCRTNNVDRRTFDSPKEDTFDGLRSACLDYLYQRYT